MRTGSEPLTAKSPLKLRFWLSVWGELLTIGATVGFSLADEPGLAAVSAVLWVLVTIDLIVVLVRLHTGHQPPQLWPM